MPIFSFQGISVGIVEISDGFPDIGTGIVVLFLKVHIPNYLQNLMHFMILPLINVLNVLTIWVSISI